MFLLVLTLFVHADSYFMQEKPCNAAFSIETYNFSHLSASDLLRAEQDRLDSQYRDLVRTCICESTIVPNGVTIKLLENVMRAVLGSISG
jgi:UMP-CMP kinase